MEAVVGGGVSTLITGGEVVGGAREMSGCPKPTPTLRGKREGGKEGPSEVAQILAASDNFPRSPVLRGGQGSLPGPLAILSHRKGQPPTF